MLADLLRRDGLSVGQVQRVREAFSEEAIASTCPWYVALSVSLSAGRRGPMCTQSVNLDEVTTGQLCVRVFAVYKSDRNVFPYITVGRTANCDVVVPDASVSKLHCYMKSSPDAGLLVIDAESTNGTFINDEAVRGRVSGGEVARVDDNVRFGLVQGRLTGARGLAEICELFLPNYS